MLIFCFSSCIKEEVSTIEISEDKGEIAQLQSVLDAGTTTFSPTIVGDTITNPYSMRIVEEAFRKLSKTSSFNADAITLSPTHLHVRFMPRDTIDERSLAADSSLTLFDVQLDRLIISYGDGYRDPDVSDGSPTYLYSAVPVDVNLLKYGVPYLVLDTLYPPDGEKDNTFVRDIEVLDKLEEEATLIAKSKSPDYPTSETRGPRYTPTARIRYLEDDESLQGLEGARITMRRWSKYGEGFTDANGIARSDKQFRREVNYQLIWERYHFAIKDSWLTRAKIDGPHQKAQWNLDIDTRGDRDWRRAQVHRGAYRYAYQDILGLSRPPRNGVLSSQLHYRVLDDTDDDGLGRHCPACQWLGFGSQIKIWVNGNSDRAQSYVATTIHETAHAAHWKGYAGDLAWRNVHDRVTEGWARGVQFALTRLHYPGYRPLYFKTYTGIVEDMLDAPDGQNAPYIFRDPNNSGFNITGPIRLDVDYVSEYTLVQIQNAAFVSSTYDEWRDNIISGSTNSTSNRLKELFLFWDSIPGI